MGEDAPAVAPHVRMTWLATVAASPVSMAAKVIAIAIAYHARDGRLMHAVETIANNVQVSERAARPAVSELVTAGLLVMERPAGGRGKPAIYSLKGATSAPFCDLERVQIPSGKGANVVAKGCKLRQERVQNLHPQRSIQRGDQRSSPEKGTGELVSSGQASEKQFNLIAMLAIQLHPGLASLMCLDVARTIAAYPRVVNERAWQHCDQCVKEYGATGREEYCWRFEGLQGDSSYRTQAKRVEPMTAVEASAWIDDLKQAIAQPSPTASKYANLPIRTVQVTP